MFHYIYTLPWNAIFMLMPLMTILSGILVFVTRMVMKKTRWVYLVLLALWTMVVVYVTLLSRQRGEYGISLRLFASHIWAKTQPEYYRANFMNLLLFFPGGILLKISLHDKMRAFMGCLATICILLGMSVLIEIAQGLFSIGTVEIDDVFYNTLGASFGCGAAVLIEKVYSKVLWKFLEFPIDKEDGKGVL